MLRRPLGPQFFPDNGYLQADVERKFARTKLPLAALIADAIAEASRKEDQRIDFAIADRSVVQSGFSQVDQATLGDWLRIIPYVDQIATVSMTGHELLRFFEDNVGRRLEEGDVEQEKGYCYFSHEIKYKVKQNSPSAPARLKEVWISDLLLKDNLDRIFRCAFPSFFRQLAKEWESTVQRPLFNLRNLDIKLLNLFVRDAVYAYIGTLNSYPTFEH
ncbi:MAG: 5'-nucleotidase C-terminal domain-containing protein, partial [Chloroflexota bacterium]